MHQPKRRNLKLKQTPTRREKLRSKSSKVVVV